MNHGSRLRNHFRWMETVRAERNRTIRSLLLLSDRPGQLQAAEHLNRLYVLC